MLKNESLIGGTLLVAGTSIGGGMLALPVLTSLGGFLPSLVIYLLCWLFMASTGLLLLEACLWMKGETNIISMAEKTLGTGGKICAWLLYLFLFYSLTLAYVAGCGNLVSELFQEAIPDWLGSVIFVMIFAPFIFAGAKIAGRLNVFLMLGLLTFYCAFVVLGYRYVNTELLQEQNWLLSLKALPVAFTAFAYQGTIPTLATYMNYNSKKTRKAILIGSFIPFIAYAVWEWLILGIVPTHGPGGLADALEKGYNAVRPLKEFIHNPNVYLVGRFFAFFALVTSFIGVGLGLLDFLADGLKVKKTPKNKLFLCLLIYLPPLLFSITHPHVFLTALDYAGGFGCALLLGLLPILMAWVGRYQLKLSSQYLLPGGRVVLFVLATFVLFEVTIEILQTLGHL